MDESARLLELFPGALRERVIKGTYLEHRVHELGTPATPFVYGNFASSLDGRIALRDEASGTSYLPSELTSRSDFRLFLELQAQADCLITHGGYMRAIAEGRLSDILQVGHRPETRDLANWRSAAGLPAQPAVVIASATLRFPIPDSLQAHGQQVHIATGKAADRGPLQELRQRGYEVIIAGEGASVEGRPLVQALGRLGYRSLYLVAGPRMLETMLRDRMLSRLYLTITHQVMGGQAFHTLISGDPLGVAGRLRLHSLYYDPISPPGAGQWFVRFDPAP
jgi:riboflavin biosynthesis pyrimidine reductase